MITSSANPRIKEIRKLRDRKYRTETNLAWVEGLRASGEAFTRPELVRQIVYCPETLHSEYADTLLKLAQQHRVEMVEVSPDSFASLSGKDNPQGMGLVIQQSVQSIENVQPKSGEIWVVLDRVADPGNLGTIMRTLDACGGKGVILVDDCTDPYDPTAIRASTGAVFHLGLVKTTGTDFIAWKKGISAQLVGVVVIPGVVDYHTCTFDDPVILMMGSEREGLQLKLMEMCDLAISIPMVGHVDSLNLAEATAIMLYEVFNQRRDAMKATGGTK